MCNKLHGLAWGCISQPIKLLVRLAWRCTFLLFIFCCLLPQHKGLFWDISYCGVIASPHTVAMASDNLEDVLSKSGVDSNLTNSLMMEGWTSQTFRMAAADSQGFEDVLHEWSSWHPLTPCRPFRRPACARLLSRFNLRREQVLRFYQLRQ